MSEVPAQQLLQAGNCGGGLPDQDGVQPHLLRRPQVAGQVVQEDGLLGGHSQAGQGQTVDGWLGLPGPLHAGLYHLEGVKGHFRQLRTSSNSSSPSKMSRPVFSDFQLLVRSAT
jgi:hypothetical protein